MIQAIKQILFWDRSRFPETYTGELNYQCNLVIVPASFICIFAWLGYIGPDSSIYPDRPAIVLLRYGLTAVSLATFLLQFFPFFKRNSMLLLTGMGVYLEVATGVITGMTAADPVYMAGYFFVLVLVIVAPINRYLLWFLSLSSVTAFIISGYMYGISFETQKQKYTLHDFTTLIIFTAVFVFVLDRMRFKNWKNSTELENKREEIAREKIKTDEIILEAKSLISQMTETADFMGKFAQDIATSVSEQSPVVKNTMTSSASVIDSFSIISDNTAEQISSNERGVILINKLKAEFSDTLKSGESVNRDAQSIGVLTDKCKNKLDNASTTINALKDETSRIAEISGTINDIADMTALLSLNASIESARAGEHGRGFAVVADEISKLADDSMRSAKEIGDIIRMSVMRIIEASDQVTETSDILKDMVKILVENRKFLEKLTGMIQVLGKSFQELMQYFNLSVSYTGMIDDLTKKNRDEITTYQKMISSIENFYSDLDSMSIDLKSTSTSVTESIYKLEEILGNS